jgi:hypothetical protein
MNLKSATALAVAFVALAGGGVVATWPASAAPADQVIRLTASGGGDHNIDLGRHGFSAGDMQVTSAALASGGHRAGRFIGSCQATRVTKSVEEQLCTWVFALHKGTISTTGNVSGTREGPGPFDFAVTGGTGQYAGAHGYLHVEPASRQPVFEVHLQP